MKKYAFTLSALGAVLLLWSFSSAHAAGGAKEEITALEHKLLAATTADEALAFMDGKSIILYDYVAPLQFSGMKAVRARFEEFFNSASDVKGDASSLNVVVDGKVGVAHSLQHFTWKDKDGKPGEGTFRVTNCWHKGKDGWKIFHSHVSFPLNAETGKAEMNLKE